MDYTKTPFFSIIVPVYNVEKYLRNCLDSIVNQTFQNFEIIVINDGSPDNSQLILDEFYKMYQKKIHLFTKPNGGLGSARNYGIGKSTGDYFLFVDSDDWLEENAVEELSKIVELSPDVELFVFDYFKVSENKKTLNKGFIGNNINKMHERVLLTQVMAWNKLYKRDIFKRITFPDGLHEDVPTIPIILSFVNEVYYLKIPLYNYLIREGSITQTEKLTNNPSFVKALSVLADRNQSEKNLYVKERCDLDLYNLIYRVYSGLNNSERLPYEKEIINYFQQHNHSFFDFFEKTMSNNQLKRLIKLRLKKYISRYFDVKS